MDRLGSAGGLRSPDRRRPAQAPVTARRKSSRFPRLRWAIRHPMDVLERGGFGPVKTAVLLLFTSGVLAWLTYTYFVYLS